MKAQLLFRCHFKGETLTTRAVRAEDGTTSYEPTKAGTAKLGAVTAYDGRDVPGMAEEIERFYQATPSGTLEFGTVNEAASAMFEPGALYRITVERI